MAEYSKRILATRGDFDACAERGAVRFLADQFHGQPIVVMAWVLKQGVVELVAWTGAAQFDENVDVSVAVPVAARNAVSFLQMSSAGGGGNISKALAADVFEHAIRHQRFQ